MYTVQYEKERLTLKLSAEMSKWILNAFLVGFLQINNQIAHDLNNSI